MADEITITSHIKVLKNNLNFQSQQPAAYQVDMTGQDGPTPGAVSIATAGTDVGLGELTTPGVCWMLNTDESNFVEVGVWDGATFHELLELQAGEHYPFRFSRNMSGLRLKADTAAVIVLIMALEA